MPLNVEENIATLDPARRSKVEDQSAKLIAQELSLRQLRKARRMTLEAAWNSRFQSSSRGTKE